MKPNINPLDYLYSLKVAFWHDMPYDEAFKLKNIHAKHTIDKELCKHKDYIDWTRIKECKNAREFNRELLNE